MKYMAVWSGGYEAPSYQLFRTAEAAFKVAREWQDESPEDIGDWIDVLELNTHTLETKRLEASPFMEEGRV
jgi:hypothetical protein